MLIGPQEAQYKVPCEVNFHLQLALVRALVLYLQDLKNIKNVKGCRDGMPKSMQTR